MKKKKKQLGLFDQFVPGCRYCGGVGNFVDAGTSTLGIGEKLEKMVCDRCTFETFPVVLDRRDILIEKWIKGVPEFVHDTNRGRTMTANEYWSCFHPPRWPGKPVPRYMGIAVYLMAR